MYRRPLTLAAVASLLLCIATVVLWVRSYSGADAIRHVRHDNTRPGVTVEKLCLIDSSIGTLAVITATETKTHAPDPSDAGWRLETREAEREGTVKWLSREYPSGASAWVLGFGFLFVDGGSFTIGAISVPHWFVALLTAIAPALRVKAVMRARRVSRSGLCPTCGYDLRATPARCPECGAVPAAPAAR